MSDIVNYDPLVAFLQHASIFEIYRVSAAIQQELDNPKRLSIVYNQISVGDKVEYYDAKSNTFVQALILKKTPRKATVQNLNDNQQWQIPLYSLKLDSREFSFEQPKHGVNKNAIKVGDFVGFYHTAQGKHITGNVTKRNLKTASITTIDRKRWRVPYQMLYPIIEGHNIDNADEYIRELTHVTP